MKGLALGSLAVLALGVVALAQPAPVVPPAVRAAAEDGGGPAAQTDDGVCVGQR